MVIIKDWGGSCHMTHAARAMWTPYPHWQCGIAESLIFSYDQNRNNEIIPSHVFDIIFIEYFTSNFIAFA